MIENPFCTPEVQGAHQLHSLGSLDLEEGGTIPDLHLAYATYGELNADKSNAIFISTWFSGTHATWWQEKDHPPPTTRTLAMDPNALLTMGWKWQRGDVARHADGDLAAALGRVTARTFVMPIDEDMFFPPRDCRREAELVPGAELRVLPSIAGHFGLFGFEQTYLDAVDANLEELLATEV